MTDYRNSVNKGGPQTGQEVVFPSLAERADDALSGGGDSSSDDSNQQDGIFERTSVGGGTPGEEIRERRNRQAVQDVAEGLGAATEDIAGATTNLGSSLLSAAQEEAQEQQQQDQTQQTEQPGGGAISASRERQQAEQREERQREAMSASRERQIAEEREERQQEQQQEAADLPGFFEEQATTEEPDPADLMVMGVGFTSSTRRVGTSETVRVRIQNLGGQRGSTQRAVFANDSQIGTVSTTLEPGEESTETLSFTIPDTDRVTLSVEGSNTTASSNVRPRPDTGTPIPNISAPNDVMVGESFDIAVEVSAGGGDIGSNTLEVLAGGETISQATVGPLPEGEKYAETFSFTAQSPGTIPVVANIADEQTSTRVNVNPEPTAEFELASFELIDNALPGEESLAAVELRNVGDAEGGVEIPVLADGVQVGAAEFSAVSPGETAQVNVRYETPGRNDYTLSLAQFNQSLNVDPPQPQSDEPETQPDEPETQPDEPESPGRPGAPPVEGELPGGISPRTALIGASVAGAAVAAASIFGGD